jgi:hypothetical protein
MQDLPKWLTHSSREALCKLVTAYHVRAQRVFLTFNDAVSAYQAGV